MPQGTHLDKPAAGWDALRWPWCDEEGPAAGSAAVSPSTDTPVCCACAVDRNRADRLSGEGACEAGEAVAMSEASAA